MKEKRLLRFYFGVDSLEETLNNLITRTAFASMGGGAEKYAGKISALLGVKEELSALWGYLDGVIGGLPAGEADVLRSYASMRGGLKGAAEDEAKNIKRVLIKFVRRARRIGEYAGAVKLLDCYFAFCLIV